MFIWGGTVSRGADGVPPTVCPPDGSQLLAVELRSKGKNLLIQLEDFLLFLLDDPIQNLLPLLELCHWTD